MTTPHLTDARVTEIALDATATIAERDHLRACGPCAVRHADLDGLLRDLALAATQESDTAFPASRLAGQRDGILRRLEREGRPARVVTFPPMRARPRIFRARPAMRWVAAAAAAGLTVGLVLGRLTHGWAPIPSYAPRAARVAPAPTRVFVPATALIPDDERLMGEIELAVARPVLVLQPIHELTPR